MLAAWTKNADWDLDDDEAEKIASRAANVARHYDVPEVAQKSKDWVMFIQAMGAIYGPRVMSTVYEARQRNAPPPAQHRAAPQNVTAPNTPAPVEVVARAAEGSRAEAPPNLMQRPPLANGADVVQPRQQPGLPHVALKPN